MNCLATILNPDGFRFVRQEHILAYAVMAGMTLVPYLALSLWIERDSARRKYAVGAALVALIALTALPAMGDPGPEAVGWGLFPVLLVKCILLDRRDARSDNAAAIAPPSGVTAP